MLTIIDEEKEMNYQKKLHKWRKHYINAVNEGTDAPEKPKRNPDKSEIERIKSIRKKEEEKLTHG